MNHNISNSIKKIINKRNNFNKYNLNINDKNNIFCIIFNNNTTTTNKNEKKLIKGKLKI